MATTSQPPARTVAIELAAVIGFGVLLALLGPFGTFALGGFAERLAYWVLLTAAGYGVYRPALIASARAAQRLELPLPALWVAGTVAATIPMTLVVWLASFRHTPALLPNYADFVTMYGQVLIIGTVIAGMLWVLTYERSADRPAEQGAAVAVPGTASSQLRHDVIALEMEDHYVRAHSVTGSSLVLMRMRDAVTQLSSVDGRQVHRSWWVARAAIVSQTSDGRNVRLHLRGGLEVPVARNHVAGLREAGWLGPRAK